MNLIYATGRPYGAPLCILRGAATKDDDIKQRMYGEGFQFDRDLHGWRMYMYDSEFVESIKRIVKDRPDVTVKPKDDQDPLVGLEGGADGQPEM